MLDYLRSWYQRYFTDPQAALLTILLVLALLVLWFMGQMLAPILAAMIIAYLLEGPCKKLTDNNVPRFLAVVIVFLIFLLFQLFCLVGLLPIVMRQISQFLKEVPSMIKDVQDLLLTLPSKYPEVITEQSVREVMAAITGATADMGQAVLSLSFSSLAVLITFMVYLILVPLMVFFFMKDKNQILMWLNRFLPADRHLVDQIWREMDDQIGNYIRGKVYEIIIVGGISYFVFKMLDLNYASLLALSVGLSVLIPYIGAFAVTIPVALVAYFEWGLTGDFFWLMSAYLVVQALDGNLLVPVLFSEAVNLHPIAIIAAIIIFGGLWGFWGVFFAIPLATLVKALINIWPTITD